jgi:hypothetical protein
MVSTKRWYMSIRSNGLDQRISSDHVESLSESSSLSAYACYSRNTIRQ